MPTCTDCRFEGPYNIQKPSPSRFFQVSQGGIAEIEMKYMQCQAPGGGPTPNPISSREANIDQPCDFFQSQSVPPHRIQKPQRTDIIELEAETLEEARKETHSRIPEGMAILAETVVSDGKPKTVKVIAETVTAGFEKACNEIPASAAIIGRKELVTPNLDRETITIEAFDEQNARSAAEAQAKTLLGDSTIVKSLALVTIGKKGFLGLGKKPNRYRAELYRQAVVEITYKPKVKLSIKLVERLDTLFKRIRGTKARKEKTGITYNRNNLQGVARHHPHGIPFVTASDHPIAFVRMEKLSGNEIRKMQAAVEQGHVTLIPQLAEYPPYPVLSLAFLIYDSPKNPFAAEGFSDISIGDVQDFLLAVAKSGTGEFLLYYGDEAELIASGSFTLILPSPGFNKRKLKFPVEPTAEDLIGFSTLIRRAAHHLETIPAPRQDFKAAVNRFLKET